MMQRDALEKRFGSIDMGDGSTFLPCEPPKVKLTAGEVTQKGFLVDAEGRMLFYRLIWDVDFSTHWRGELR